jgi:hypothetical protein
MCDTNAQASNLSMRFGYHQFYADISKRRTAIAKSRETVKMKNQVSEWDMLWRQLTRSLQNQELPTCGLDPGCFTMALHLLFGTGHGYTLFLSQIDFP